MRSECRCELRCRVHSIVECRAKPLRGTGRCSCYAWSRQMSLGHSVSLFRRARVHATGLPAPRPKALRQYGRSEGRCPSPVRVGRHAVPTRRSELIDCNCYCVAVLSLATGTQQCAGYLPNSVSLAGGVVRGGKRGEVSCGPLRSHGPHAEEMLAALALPGHSMLCSMCGSLWSRSGSESVNHPLPVPKVLADLHRLISVCPAALLWPPHPR